MGVVIYGLEKHFYVHVKEYPFSLAQNLSLHTAVTARKNSLDNTMVQKGLLDIALLNFLQQIDTLKVN